MVWDAKRCKRKRLWSISTSKKLKRKATENAARKEHHTKAVPRHQGTAFLHALRREILSPTNVRKKLPRPPVFRLHCRPAHLCRWPSAPRCLIRLTPSASTADAAMARARRRSRTPAGRTERRSRRGHHPGHRPGKVRADAPCGTRRPGYSPIKKTLSALSQKGSTGVQGV